MFNSVRLATGKPDHTGPIVIGVFTDKKLDSAAKALDADGSISAALARSESTGELGKIVEAFAGWPARSASGKGAQRTNAPRAGKQPPRILIVGLGKRDSFKAGSLRTVGGAIGRRLAAIKEPNATLRLSPALESVKGLDLEIAGRCLGEGLGLIGWSFLSTRFKGTGSKKEGKEKLDLRVGADSADLSAGVGRGLALARSVNIARDMSETPPNIATPEYIANFAKRMAREVGLKCTVMEGTALERERMTGLVNVGKASENGPCLIRLEWSPGARGAGRPIVLVGKTMTYDTGGLSLKVNNGMVGMKRDKDGGCAVLGAMHAIATVVRPNKRVVAYLAAAENSISDEAYRPDDVLTYRNGVTVEVTNTDAEGRLVLADALIYACENDNPACVIDMATLTGGVVTALGSTFAGLFCEDDRLRQRLTEAMDASGERWWRLPMDQEYRDMMKSPIADIVNSNPNRKAHPIQGAAFLSYFVKENVPWAHIDIAGVHMAESDAGYLTKGSNGWGVRLMAEFVGL